MRFTVWFVSFSLFLTLWSTRSVLSNQIKEPDTYLLEPGTQLEITVYREEDLSGTYEIDPAGHLTFPLIGDLPAAGLEIEKLRLELTNRLKKYLVEPQVSISHSEGSVKSISILGHVMKPGVYDYGQGSTLMRLISSAGGFAESANKRKIKIVRMVDQEKRVIIVNGLDVINGEDDDPQIEPGDIIFVPESIF